MAMALFTVEGIVAAGVDTAAMISSMFFTRSSEAETGLIPGTGESSTATCLIISSGVGALDSFFVLLHSASEI